MLVAALFPVKSVLLYKRGAEILLNSYRNTQAQRLENDLHESRGTIAAALMKELL